MKAFSLRFTCKVLIVSMLALSYSAPTRAALIGTGQAAAQGERERVASFMARADVTRQLAALGVSPSGASERVAALSDDEVAQLAGKIDALPAAGDFGFIAAILVVLLFVILLYMGDNKR